MTVNIIYYCMLYILSLLQLEMIRQKIMHDTRDKKFSSDNSDDKIPTKELDQRTTSRTNVSDINRNL